MTAIAVLNARRHIMSQRQQAAIAAIGIVTFAAVKDCAEDS